MYIRFSLHLCNHLPDITKRCCCCLVPQLCPTLDYCPPGFSVHGIFQARILQWVAISFSRGSYRPRDQTHVSESPALQADSLPTELWVVKHTGWVSPTVGWGAGVLIHQLQLIMDSGSQGVLNGQQNWLLWQKENLRQKCKCLQLGETENIGGT